MRAGAVQPQPIPAILVMLLRDLGKIPVASEPTSGRGSRRPGLAEMESLTWLALWRGPRLDGMGFRAAAGLIAYRNEYDFHTASDVRAIYYVAGYPRAVVEMLRYVRDTAGDRRVVGSCALDNHGLRRLLGKMGGVETRVVVEAV